MSSKEPQEEQDRKAGGASPAGAIGATQPGEAAPAASEEAETRPPGSVEGDGAAANTQSDKPARSRGASPKRTKAKGASSKTAGKAAAAKKSNKGKEGGKGAKSKTSSSKSSSSSSAGGGSAGRLKPGALDDIVLDYMRKHPDELPISPTGISKGTGRSSGAIGNCLERLKKAKKVRRVEDKPRKYDLPKEK